MQAALSHCAAGKGWSGSWRASALWVNQSVAPETAAQSPAGCASVRIGHGEFVATALEPGESVRSMLVVAVTVTPAETAAAVDAGAAGATGDLAAGPARIGFNKHRRLMVDHRLPRNPRTGQIDGGIVASWSWIGWGQPTEANQLWHVDAVKNTSVEYYWLDAGWFDGGFPSGVGNWSLPLDQCVDKTSFPSGSLAGLGARAHAGPNRTGFIVWFEPERVAAGTYIDRTFPEYVLKDKKPSQLGMQGGLLNLGKPDAREYIREYLASAVDQYGLDVLRIDFNTNPKQYWDVGDAGNRSRTGITELKYIEGLYTLWDSILAAHPGLMIDDCSSGGRRIDVETLSRSFPLWRSDYARREGGPLAHQAATIGISNFAPVSSGAVFGTDPHSWRSAGVVGKTISWGLGGWQKVLASPIARAELEAGLAETKSIRATALSGDYFVLAGGMLNQTDWAGYQFAARDTSAGFAYIFRNSAAETSFVAELQAIDRSCQAYTVELYYGYHLNRTTTATGIELSNFTVMLSVLPSGTLPSLLLKYAKADVCLN